MKDAFRDAKEINEEEKKMEEARAEQKRERDANARLEAMNSPKKRKVANNLDLGTSRRTTSPKITKDKYIDVIPVMASSGVIGTKEKSISEIIFPSDLGINPGSNNKSPLPPSSSSSTRIQPCPINLKGRYSCCGVDRCIVDLINMKRLKNQLGQLPSFNGVDKLVEKFSPTLVHDVLCYFKARRKGIINALTTDSKSFLDECDPDLSTDLSLYADNDGQWKVSPRKSHFVEPEPRIGINFARKRFAEEKDWLFYVARHSDSWLISVAFYYGTILEFDANDRKILGLWINELPTINDAVMEYYN